MIGDIDIPPPWMIQRSL